MISQRQDQQDSNRVGIAAIVRAGSRHVMAVPPANEDFLYHAHASPVLQDCFQRVSLRRRDCRCQLHERIFLPEVEPERGKLEIAVHAHLAHLGEGESDMLAERGRDVQIAVDLDQCFGRVDDHGPPVPHGHDDAEDEQSDQDGKRHDAFHVSNHL